MPTGRKPQLRLLADNDKCRYTKAELDAREAAEPRGCSDKLTPPKTLSKLARTEWRRVVGLYRELESPILNDLDVGVLTAYCEARAIYIAAERGYSVSPIPIVKDRSGDVFENPYLGVMRKEAAIIAKLSEQLCMSPVGRARMGVAAAKREKDGDEMEALLSSPRIRGFVG